MKHEHVNDGGLLMRMNEEHAYDLTDPDRLSYSSGDGVVGNGHTAIHGTRLRASRQDHDCLWAACSRIPEPPLQVLFYRTRMESGWEARCSGSAEIGHFVRVLKEIIRTNPGCSMPTRCRWPFCRSGQKSETRLALSLITSAGSK